MLWKSKLLYSQNWNIGFVEQTVTDLLRNKKLGRIRWMKHSYHDRWFADPFIYKVTEQEIVVFVEECLIEDSSKGILCELHIDRESMRLRERYVLLDLDTHLSYPAIFIQEGVTYVYPENGASGCLKMYRYDAEKHVLVDPVCILNEAVADSTILYDNGFFYLIATSFMNSQEKAFLYKSVELRGMYQRVFDAPVQTGRNCSRPAGDWIRIKERIYRPAQNCEIRYGGAISVMSLDLLNPYKESILFSISPVSFRYNRGLHTINCHNSSGLIVVDGYGFLHPLLSRIWVAIARLKHSLLRK